MDGAVHMVTCPLALLREPTPQVVEAAARGACYAFWKPMYVHDDVALARLVDHHWREHVNQAREALLRVAEVLVD